MKSKTIYVVILSIVLCLSNLKAKSQNNGCDLCGPDGTYKNIASGSCSATIGAACESRGLYSFSVGYFSKAYAASSIAMGRYVKVQGTNSVVIGSGVSTAETRLLTNDVSNSLMVGFNSCLPTLFVSTSDGYNTTGKIGIGNVKSPKAKLHMRSDSNEDAGVILESGKSAYIQFLNDKNRISAKSDAGLSIMSKDSNINFEAKQLVMDAKVTINISGLLKESDYALAVPQGIMTNKVMVKEVSEWYDDVFNDDYDLLTIDNVERYIAENGHLPDIPSEHDVFQSGYDMVEMDGLLLKKIEELTLYTIELNNLIKSQQELIESLLAQ